jgi:hypothetical protein
LIVLHCRQYRTTAVTGIAVSWPRIARFKKSITSEQSDLRVLVAMQHVVDRITTFSNSVRYLNNYCPWPMAL